MLRWHITLEIIEICLWLWELTLFRKPLFPCFPFPHQPWFFLISHVAHRTCHQPENATNRPYSQKWLISLGSPPYFILLYSSNSFTWFFALFQKKKKYKLFPFTAAVHYALIQGCLESYSMSALTWPLGASQSRHGLDTLLPQWQPHASQTLELTCRSNAMVGCIWNPQMREREIHPWTLPSLGKIAVGTGLPSPNIILFKFIPSLLSHSLPCI